MHEKTNTESQKIYEKMLQDKILDKKNLNCSSHALLARVWNNPFLYHCWD